jgi:tripartite motif-containing protein 71
MKAHAWRLASIGLVLLALGAVPVLADPSAEGTDGVVEVFPAKADPSLLPDGTALAEAVDEAARKAAERKSELESPTAEAQRQQSESAYREIESATAVSDLLKDTFGAELAMLEQDPARFLTDAALQQSLGETDARVSREGETEILEGTTPVRMPDEEGDLRKVDLSLEQTGAGFAPENPIVELDIAPAASEGIEIDGETRIAQAGVDPTSGAHPFGEKDVIYPEVLTDTDLLVSPISTGVEIFNQLRSPLSPEALRFDLSLPAGAELRANAGAAEVYEGEELRATVSPPSAVDAQGTRVPVTMDVEGRSLVLSVPHRQADYAYPILVDPEYTQNDWVSNAWIFGYAYHVLEDGTFLANWNNSKILTSRWCIYSCWGKGRGLFISVPSGTYSAQQWAHWSFTPPGETTYLTGYLINPFYRYDFTSPCWADKHPNPHDYDGLWDPAPPYYGWTSFYTNRALATNAATYNTYGKSLIFGMTSSSGSSDPCWRDLYAGGIATYMSDPDYPLLDAISGYPTGWFDDSKKSLVNVSAHDKGLGVQNVQLNIEGKPQVLLKPAPCYGTHDSPCPRDMSGPIYFDGDNFPEGRSLAKVVASDALSRASNLDYFWANVDSTPPEVTLSGQLAKATSEAGSEEVPAGKGDQLGLPVYDLTIKATDGSNETDKARRSGMKNIEVFLDDKEKPEEVPWSPKSTPCESCEMTQTYTLKLNTLEAGKHTLRVVAKDQLGHARERHIEFEFIPATGMKDSYVLQYFPLPDGQGDEEAEEHPSRPELAVNLINGNLVYRERDVEVEGYGADLEVERYYNSLLPESENTEWGDGWTLAQTPELDPEAGEAPKEAEVLDTSGALESEVELPTTVGESSFDPSLQASLTKEAGGGFELSDESGESDTSIAFDKSGRAEELRTEGYATVEYDYAGDELEEIAVKDPGSAGDLSPTEEEAFEYVPPAPSYQSAFGALGTGDGQLKSPGDVAVALNGDLFVVDRANNRIQRFTSEGKYVSKFGSYGTGNGQFNRPCSIAIDPSGNLWVADANNNRVQKFNEKGEFLKAVGSLGTGNAQFKEPEGITTDAKGNVLVADSFNQRIQKLNSAGEYLAKFGSSGTGNGQFNQVNSIDVGPGGKVWAIDWSLNRVTQFNEAGEFVQKFGAYGTGNGQFNHPDAIEVDSRGNVWVGDQSNHRIQQFNQAGKYLAQFGTKGSGSGQFNFTWPMGIAADNKGGLWVADVSNNRIQRFSVPGYRPTWFGALGSVGSGDGQLKTPTDVAVADNGDVWVLDQGNKRVQRFDVQGKYVSKFGSYGTGNGQFVWPTAIAMDSSGNLWVVDSGACRIQKFDQNGTFIAKYGSFGVGNGQFNEPEGIAADLMGNVYVADTYNARIQKFNEAGEFLAKFGTEGKGDGQFIEVNALDVGKNGTVWAADWEANRITQFSADGKFIRKFGASGTGEGQFSHPYGIEADNKGNVWVADQGASRVELFNEAGEYLTQFGAKGSGNGQFNFTRPVGLVSEPISGDLWIADSANNRIQKWLLPDTDPPKAPEENDPSLEVDTAEDLVTELSGEEAGEHDYEHTGDLLTAHEGPAGETTYEYDGAGRMTKVTLPNGTWGQVTYNATYGWVTKVTVDPAGSEPAKSTSFAYSSEPRRTTVTPEKDPVVTYDIGEDGSILKWQNVVKPPSFDNLSGSLYVGRENPTPINVGVHNLGIQAYSAEGIAQITIVANGNQVVSERDCEQSEETPEIDCVVVKDEWVTETEDHPPGLLYVEAIIEDRLGKLAAQRFWVNIPQPPPPPPHGAPVKPKFKEILSFREEHGLDLDLNPATEEQALNERVFNLINAWTEGDPVARASWERWGVPLRSPDVAELDDRLADYAQANQAIPAWASANSPTSYAGFYMSEPEGGVIHVGFTGGSGATQLAALKQSGVVAGSDRLAGFTPSATYSLQELEGLEAAINAFVAGLSSSSITTVGIDVQLNRVRVGANDTGQAETLISNQFGVGSAAQVFPEPIEVHASLPATQPPSGRFRDWGAIRAGDFITSMWLEEEAIEKRKKGFIVENTGCTAGVGAWENGVNPSSGRPVRRFFLLAAGHCFLPEDVMVRANPETQILRAFGMGKRVGFPWGSYGGTTTTGHSTDIAAIRVDEPIHAPRHIFREDGKATLGIGGVALSPGEGARVCHSGITTGTVRCGEIFGPARELSYVPVSKNGKKQFIQVCYDAKSLEGDSGGPVWIEGTRLVVGSLSFGWDKVNPVTEKVIGDVTCFTPLSPLPDRPSAPGALAAPGIGHLHPTFVE